jgi:acyl-CoA thioesterase
MVGLAFRDRLELLLVDEPSLVGSTGGWVRLREEPSTVGLQSAAGVLALLLDVMPPGLFAVRPRPRFVPTLSFSVHFATDVDPDPTAWMYLTHETAWATDSLCVDESTVWSRTGRLLAQGRQTRAVRWPDVG